MASADGHGAVETIEAAPAKINLALHVTGQREDGYHLLETLVTFTLAGDVLRFREAEEDGFSISGRFAPELMASGSSENLVLKARDLFRNFAAKNGSATRPVAIHLEKNLPIASGIGGGSADAAAALRGLRRHWKLEIGNLTLQEMALALGADVPMCLTSRPLIARGIGEKIEQLSRFPNLSMVLANPLKGVSTPHIFRLLTEKNNPSLPPIVDDNEAGGLQMLRRLRNDLQPSAISLLPEIDTILSLLSSEGAELARMSGSGATCFGIFPTIQKAKAAAAALRQTQPGWYVQETMTIAGGTS